jgi:hypothetical protein
VIPTEEIDHLTETVDEAISLAAEDKVGEGHRGLSDGPARGIGRGTVFRRMRSSIPQQGRRPSRRFPAHFQGLKGAGSTGEVLLFVADLGNDTRTIRPRRDSNSRRPP